MSRRICHTTPEPSAPGNSSPVVTSRAVASRKPSQNTPMVTSSETTIAPTCAAAPPRTLPALVANPDSTEVAITPSPMDRITPMLRSWFHGKPGRRLYGTAQTLLSAVCTALATPRAPRNVKIRPITSAIPVVLSECTLFLRSWPRPGNWA